jgi:hypothetical protein
MGWVGEGIVLEDPELIDCKLQTEDYLPGAVGGAVGGYWLTLRGDRISPRPKSALLTALGR